MKFSFYVFSLFFQVILTLGHHSKSRHNMDQFDVLLCPAWKKLQWDVLTARLSSDTAEWLTMFSLFDVSLRDYRYVTIMFLQVSENMLWVWVGQMCSSAPKYKMTGCPHWKAAPPAHGEDVGVQSELQMMMLWGDEAEVEPTPSPLCRWVGFRFLSSPGFSGSSAIKHTVSIPHSLYELIGALRGRALMIQVLHKRGDED